MIARLTEYSSIAFSPERNAGFFKGPKREVGFNTIKGQFQISHLPRPQPTTHNQQETTENHQQTRNNQEPTTNKTQPTSVCQAWVHLSGTRVGGSACHVPGIGACERHARGRALTMCQAWVHLSDMRVCGCAYPVPGMDAFERHARGRGGM